MGLEILVVDDHPMVRMGLIFLLRERAGFNNLREASTAAEAIAMIQEKPPDVVLLDVRLPDKSGIEVCREIKDINPSIKVIMITSFTDEEALFSSIMAGANGYFLKKVAPEELLNAIRKVCQGESVIDSQYTGQILDKLRQNLNPAEQDKPELSHREQQILEFIARGKSNREIADILFLSSRTVKNYISKLYLKLEVRNRAEAAAFTVKQKWYQAKEQETTK